MFSKESKNGVKKNGEYGSGINLIGASTKIKGEITTKGDLRIDGTIEGNVVVHAKLVLGNKALIKGEVFCENADLSGNITGNVVVSELIHLKSTARIDGTLQTRKMIVEDGARFNGNCKMHDGIKLEDSIKKILNSESNNAKDAIQEKRHEGEKQQKKASAL